ncbi:MAG: ATP-dependent DNA helicase, partial [Chlamydiae bacterium]|nr:ATP-dependent DNA helicase [Chlamydiota bacterium]
MRQDTLNSSQDKAVRTIEGRILVLAGAGSGKTRVIIHRIVHLIREKEVSPDTIVGLTFTNKAAKEMRERLVSLIGKESAKKVTLSTFHSYCMQVLRKEIEKLGYTKEFSLYDERDLDRLIGQLANEMSDGEEPPSLATTKASLDEAMQSGGDLKEHTWKDPFAKDLFMRLQSMLRAHNAVTFDHLIQLTIRLFEGHPEVLRKYQKKCRYLMIDEYQDTNSAQFRLAELLCSGSGNVCVVGDDDQSIYGWRGAEVQHILRFPSDHKIKLEQNYRSTPMILDAANAVIQHNKNRHDKKLWSAKDRGEPIEVFNAPTDVEEAVAIAERIVRLHEKENLKWKDIAILYRSNVLSRQFELALMQVPWKKDGNWIRGIPYDIYGGVAFSERSEIKDLMAYLRLIANVKDEEALLRIINTPRRGVSDALLDELTQTNRSWKIPLWEILKEIASGKKNFPSHPRGMNGIRSFVSLIETAQKRFQENSKAEALIWLLEAIQYKKAI